MGLATTDLTVGSSPLTRGKLFSSVWEGIKGGLIPAHAGKTTAHRPNTQGRGAHPRSRGENARTIGTLAVQDGSSPLTRGKLAGNDRVFGAYRLIPAHAGKTTAHRPNTQGRGAHPRSRGENAALDEEGAGVEGSSPLTRGKRGSVPGHCLVRGLIPAHAGKTIV